MSEECKPASEIIGREFASSFGDKIEDFIRKDYCLSKGGCRLFPTSNQDFSDNRIFGNQLQFIAYLKANNPQVDEIALSIQASIPDAIKVPDLVTHQPGRFEFYEIKPNSQDGRSKGQGKVFATIALCGINKLPYLPGLIYNPNVRRSPANTKIDGIVGPKTISAIRSFQQKAGIVGDGRVDSNQATIRALEQQHLAGILSSVEVKLPELFRATSSGKSIPIAGTIDKQNLMTQYLKTIKDGLG
jgi:Putative peptidoglycan binding domain